MKKKWYILIIAVVAVVAVWLGTRRGNAKIPETTIKPYIEKVVTGDLRLEVTTTGIIEPINKVEIKSKASGLIEELNIEESDIVKKGDLIARLDQRDTKNAYDQSIANLDVAQATVKQRESDFERSKELFEKGLISAAEYDQAKLALVEARAQVVRAKIDVDNNDIRLKDTVVRSPINGVVLTKEVEEGQIISSGISSVSGGTLISTVANMKEVYVKADVDEVDIGKITPGMKTSVIADAYPNVVFYGDVIRIAAQAKVEQNVTSFEVTIKVQNPEDKLKAGMNTSVEILVTDKRDVLLVPNDALMTQKEMMQELGKIKLMLGPKTEGQKEKKGRDSSDQVQRPEAGQEQAMGEQQGTGQRQGGRQRPGGGQRRDSRPEPQAENTAEENEGSSLRRGVIVKQGDEYLPKLVKVGVSNYDYTEVIDGLNEGDEVVYTFFSRAKESSDEFRDRMRERSGMASGFRNTQSR